MHVMSLCSYAQPIKRNAIISTFDFLLNAFCFTCNYIINKSIIPSAPIFLIHLYKNTNKNKD